ncbi:NmrA family NAD(P)-binding protein [Paenibacillus alvei]|uniref:NmrA family NAD(P)-binding protein n=2 Tax=Paenibacillus alvei TaxID=44250 RepID=A0ABT4GYX3_PAEAL|nr:NmrA family NAD(P)-binding protein [Paenibacillus alvei]EJW15934.1 hypothetical protein PAV_6c00120 [Paenibacillus alvei DSM 29]MCY7482769.1 NmrA family NAD(P)-binding protein [Paenibacillus alvei]MCY9704706.1 NmrA family NAD(P)-binding protein [Paenibacillus alvei]MCY9732635.1 NmrA family NAD(P)-binding protein [Paenibacillus alvei]MCY9755045.1 NmrA family NAD(P)-binding protein [Paenibacillus alvei]
MIVIIGATGTIGNALLTQLVQSNTPVRAISRETEKLKTQLGKVNQADIEVAQADASDIHSLHCALQGADQLFVAMSNSPLQVELESNVIRTAAEVGIEHIVKISSPEYRQHTPVEVARWHQEIEQIIHDSNMLHTILRPYAFMQNLLRMKGSISKQNAFYGSMGDAVCNFIDCRDIAAVAAVALTNREKAGRTYTLTGSELFNYEQIAAKFTTLLGRAVRYIDLDRETHLRNLMEYEQMPAWLANHVVEIQAMSAAIPEQPTRTVANLLGQEPRTLDAFLQEHIGLFR